MIEIKRIAAVVATVILASGLSACYVVPIDQYPQHNNYNRPHTAVVPMAIVRPPLTARLYPTNDSAARQGGASGLISNPEQGHGQFNFALGGETYGGEATRSGSNGRGVANASGNRGGYARCEYAMSNSERGAGTCTFSNGARYDLHISD